MSRAIAYTSLILLATHGPFKLRRDVPLDAKLSPHFPFRYFFRIFLSHFSFSSLSPSYPLSVPATGLHVLCSTLGQCAIYPGAADCEQVQHQHRPYSGHASQVSLSYPVVRSFLPSLIPVAQNAVSEYSGRHLTTYVKRCGRCGCNRAKTNCLYCMYWLQSTVCRNSGIS